MMRINVIVKDILQHMKAKGIHIRRTDCDKLFVIVDESDTDIDTVSEDAESQAESEMDHIPHEGHELYEAFIEAAYKS